MTRTARTIALLTLTAGSLLLGGTAHADTLTDPLFTHSSGYLFLDDDGNTVALPEGAPLKTTPVICVENVEGDPSAALLCVPDEAPDGAHIAAWLDNSPVYGDTWQLLVDDSTGAVTWVSLTYWV